MFIENNDIPLYCPIRNGNWQIFHHQQHPVHDQCIFLGRVFITYTQTCQLFGIQLSLLYFGQTEDGEWQQKATTLMHVSIDFILTQLLETHEKQKVLNHSFNIIQEDNLCCNPLITFKTMKLHLWNFGLFIAAAHKV